MERGSERELKPTRRLRGDPLHRCITEVLQRRDAGPIGGGGPLARDAARLVAVGEHQHPALRAAIEGSESLKHALGFAALSQTYGLCR